MAQALGGIGKKGRSQLAILLKTGQAVFTPESTARDLQVTRAQATQLLAQWTKQGWCSRLKHGVYIPVSLQASSSEVMADEPWLIAKALFDPCYNGGWTAAEHWNLTEQIFNSVMVFTTKKTHEKNVQLKGARFTTKTVRAERNFGTKNIWIKSQKVPLSDPTKTIVDAFNDPAVVGGIRMAIDLLGAYLKSEHKDLRLLVEYASRMKNTAIFKRLGCVLEKTHSSESAFIEELRKKIKAGYSQLDPSTPGTSLVTAWGLWVPAFWKKGSLNRDNA